LMTSFSDQKRRGRVKGLMLRGRSHDGKGWGNDQVVEKRIILRRIRYEN